MAIAFQHLIRDPNGDTEIAGAGLRVSTVFTRYEMGETAEYLADQYDLPVAAVQEALAYAADHPEEMGAIRQADEAAEQRVNRRLPDQFRREAELVAEADRQAYQEAVRRAKEARRSTPLP